MKIVYKKISDLKEWDRNPKNHNIPALKSSIERFGFRSPIIIQKGTGRIIAGHGRVRSLTAMGTTEEVPCVEWDVKNEAEMEAYGVIDNTLTMFPGMDDLKLSIILQDIKIEIPDINFDMFGFDEIDLKSLLGESQEVEIKEQEFDENMETNHECPSCGYKW